MEMDTTAMVARLARDVARGAREAGATDAMLARYDMAEGDCQLVRSAFRSALAADGATAGEADDALVERADEVRRLIVEVEALVRKGAR